MPTLYRQFADQAAIDAQYNAAASVPDFARHVQLWRSGSQAARDELPCTLGLAYGPTLAETLDIFAAPRPGAPVHVFFHGGYWRAFGARDFSFVARGLRERGFLTVVVDYALCPWVSMDEIVRQARASIAWVHRHIAAHGGDPARISVSGHSAGGHLAMMSLLAPWQQRYGLPDDLIKGAISISGLHELAPLRYSYLQPVLQLDEGTIECNSPIRHVRPVSSPVLLAWGEHETAEFARQGRDFGAALQAAGSQVELMPIAGAHHFTVLDGYLDAGSPLLGAIARAAGIPPRSP